MSDEQWWRISAAAAVQASAQQESLPLQPLSANAHGHILSCEDLRASYCGTDRIPDIGVTTLMLRQVPRHFTLEQLLSDIETVVPRTAYDFVHLPFDAKRSGNITLAFVNFVHPEAALRAFVALSGRRWSSASAQPCRMTVAKAQGLYENLAHYESRMGRPGHTGNPPLVLWGGRAIAPADALRLLRCRDGEPLVAHNARGATSGPSPWLCPEPPPAETERRPARAAEQRPPRSPPPDAVPWPDGLRVRAPPVTSRRRPAGLRERLPVAGYDVAARAGRQLPPAGFSGHSRRGDLGRCDSCGCRCVFWAPP